MLIFKLLASYLALGIDPPDPNDPNPPADPPVVVDPADGEDDLANLGDDDPPAPAAADDDSADPDVLRERLRTERTARETAERNHREAAERLAAQERARAAPPAGQTEEQRLFEQEEAVLNNPQSTEQQRYWANANRTLRASARDAQQARLEAARASDRADYSTLMQSNKLATKYQKRVQEKQDEMLRTNGQFVSSRICLKLLIGDDIVEGRVKTTKKAAPAPAPVDRQPAQRVDRGHPPAQRSDVRGRGAQVSEHDKRRARLENVQI